MECGVVGGVVGHRYIASSIPLSHVEYHGKDTMYCVTLMYARLTGKIASKFVLSHVEKSLISNKQTKKQ